MELFGIGLFWCVFGWFSRLLGVTFKVGPAGGVEMGRGTTGVRSFVTDDESIVILGFCGPFSADFDEHPVMTKSATSPNSSSALCDLENDVIASIPLLAGTYLLASFVPIPLLRSARVST